VKKRILFAAIPEKGHLNPMIGPAMHLQLRGHAVAFHAPGDLSGQLSRAGISSVAAAPESGASPQSQDSGRGEHFARQVRDPQWLRGWIRTLLVDAAPAQVGPIRAAIRLFRPDAVAADPMIYAAAIAAHLEGVPWFALSNSLNPVLDDSIASDLLETVRWLSSDREALFRRHGLEMRFNGCDMISPQLTIAFTTREFVGREVPGVQLVGPSIPPGARGDEEEFPWERLRPERPLVYLAFGSQIYHQPEIFRLVIEATSSLDVQLLIVANELHGSSLLGDLPDHVLTCHYAPQLAVLAKTRAAVTHGGANSVMEAMHFGVPVLISPVCNDQFHQAHFIRRNGAGRVLDLGSATVRECRETLIALLNDDKIRAAVAPIYQSYQRDGAAAAADLIERHA
jgi:zeaxanthin glucosyltransferase